MTRDAIDILLEQGAAHKGILTGDDAATRAVNGIFADLRGRRFLKWLFDPEGEGEVAAGVDVIDLETQQEIAETWRAIIRRALDLGL